VTEGRVAIKPFIPTTTTHGHSPLSPVLLASKDPRWWPVELRISRKKKGQNGLLEFPPSLIFNPSKRGCRVRQNSPITRKFPGPHLDKMSDNP